MPKVGSPACEVEANLFDIDAKFGDVAPVERVLAWLRRSPGQVSR